MIYLVLFVLVFINLRIYEQKKYYAGLFFTLAMIYELSIIIAFTMGDQYYYLWDRLAENITKDTIDTALKFQLVFFSCMFIGISIKTNKIITLSLCRKKISMPNIYFLYSSGLLLLIFGLISRLSGGGESRIEQYALGFNEVLITPFHFYGATILPLVGFFCITSIFNKKYKLALILLVMASPTLYDLFLAGRRQMFAPVLFILFYFVLSNKKISSRKKIFTSGFILLSSLTIFAIQFSLRYRAMGALSGDEVSYTNYIGNIFGPQIVEFVAVGATSLSAYRDIIWQNNPALGIDSLVVFLFQNLPIFGNFFKTLLHTNSLNNFSFSSIAPYGALSVQAEGIIFLGYFGVIIYGLLTGCLISFLDNGLKAPISRDNASKFWSIVIFCLASILLFKYRSGLIDILATIFNFIIFSLFSYILGLIIFKINRGIKWQNKPRLMIGNNE